jgi:hypothetical protein
MTPLSFPLLALCALLGCTAAVPVPDGGTVVVQVTPDDPCGAQSLQGFIGQHDSVVHATTFEAPGDVRVIRPGQGVTADFSSQRINFQTDAWGIVIKIDCG